MAEDRGGTSDLSHLQRANSEMWRHQWIFQPVTASRLYQSYYCARTEHGLLTNLPRAARETRLRFYLLSRLVSLSHRQLNQFCNKDYKFLLLCLSLLNLTEMREPSRALSMSSHKKGKKIAILTHATARVSCTRRSKLTSTR